MNPTAVEHLFRTACGLYAGSLLAYLAILANDRQGLARLATGLAAAGFATHTVWIGLRWYLSAAAEVSAGQAIGHAPGWGTALLAHPPLTNLYESLVVTAWCVVGIFLVLERRWKLWPVGVMVLGVGLAAMAEAYLVTEKELRPLAPALQSWWLAAHVIVLFLAYALFLVAAALAFLSLLKGGTPMPAMGIGVAGSVAAILLATGLAHGLGRLAFELRDPAGAVTGVAGVGPLLAVTIACFLVAAAVWATDLKAARKGERGLLAMKAALGSLGLTLAVLGAMSKPFALSLKGNYGLGLLFVSLVISAAFVALATWRERVLAGLPERAALDDLTHRAILVAFPLLGLGIVMGAFWAYDAWGTYWSWDPKETWSLVSFLVYALYLHTRRTLGWTGRRTAVVAIVGFALVVFMYLGVNLGLTGDGLHTYGSG
ncbi:MAG TPA: cytochrome c biogenesis protein CcsA [Myxococcales bacterium]|jgi:ABC-type transport system involved in cytochrome c biogenesis permease subunit